MKDAFAEDGNPDALAARAMLARLVRYAMDNPPPLTPLEPPEAVVEAVREAQMKELGPFGRWLLSNVEEDPSQNVTIGQIWTSWAKQAGGDPDNEEIGGFLRGASPSTSSTCMACPRRRRCAPRAVVPQPRDGGA